MSDNIEYGKLEVDHTYDPVTDEILVRVRKIYRAEDGRLIKKGIIFKVSEECLYRTPEGQQYPGVLPNGFDHQLQHTSENIEPKEKKVDRFESITDELK